MNRRKPWIAPGLGGTRPMESFEITELPNSANVESPLPPPVDLTPCGPPIEILELQPSPLPPPSPPFDRESALAGLQAAFSQLDDNELQVARLRMLGMRIVDVSENLGMIDEEVEKLWKSARNKLGNALFGKR